MTVERGTWALPQVIPAVFVLHSTGFFLGYWLSKLMGTTDKIARTNSIEVGQQTQRAHCGTDRRLCIISWPCNDWHSDVKEL